MNKKKLDQLQNRINRLVMQRQKRMNSARILLTEWKLRDVIPYDRWQSILRSQGYREALDYFPDKFDPSPFGKYAPKDEDKEYDQWLPDCESLLILTRNPDAGSRLCNMCLLKEVHDDRSSIEVIRRTIRNAIIQSIPEDEDHNIAARVPNYPCNVLNRFACPYRDCGSTFNDESLVVQGGCMQLLCQAISFS